MLHENNEPNSPIPSYNATVPSVEKREPSDVSFVPPLYITFTCVYICSDCIEFAGITIESNR